MVPSRTIGAMREHVDAVLVDFDGTLFDTAPDLIAALNRLLTEMGHAPVAFENFRQRAGEGAKRLLLAALDAQGAERPDDAALRPLIERLIAYYFEIETEQIQPFRRSSPRSSACATPVSRSPSAPTGGIALRAACSPISA